MDAQPKIEILDKDAWQNEVSLPDKRLVQIGSDPKNDIVLATRRGTGVAPRHLQLIRLSGDEPKVRIVNLTDGSEKPLGQWNTMVIECVGDAVKVWVNGDLVNLGTKCTATKGQIALQAEGSEVEFRKLELTPITELSE